MQDTHSYEFNSVLGGDATQADVCQALNIDSKVSAALDGFPVLLFAFGQTSAGKTHTVVGSLAVCLSATTSKNSEDPVESIVEKYVNSSMLVAGEPMLLALV